MPINSYDVVVTPTVDTSEARAANTDGHTDSFTVSNQGSVQNRFGFTCNGDDGVDCPTPPDSMTIDAFSDSTVIVTYNVGGAPADGFGTLTFTASGTNTAHFDSIIVPITGSSATVSVTPDDGAVEREVDSGSYAEWFWITHNGSASETYDLSCDAPDLIDCTGHSDTTLTLADGETDSVQVFYTVGSDPGQVPLTLTASLPGVTNDNGQYDVTVAQYGVEVTPDGQLADTVAADDSVSIDFTVTNTGSHAHTFDLSCTTADSVKTCSAVSTVTLDTAQSEIVPVSFTTGGPGSGTGTITLHAFSTLGSASNAGSYTVPVAGAGVSVTPDDQALQGDSGTSNVTADFEVQNIGPDPQSYAATCEGTGGILCTMNDTTFTLSNGAKDTLTATYDVGATGGVLRLIVSSTSGAAVADTGSYIVSLLAITSVAVGSEVSNAVTFADSTASQAFFVKNTTDASRTYDLSTFCAGTASACSVSPGSVTLSGGESRTLDVEFDTGADNTTGTVRLIATQSDDASEKDSAEVGVQAVATSKPIVEIETVNAGGTVARDLCLRIGIPGGSYECGDLRLAHALPSIRTLNKLRTPVLTYNSQDADPTHIIIAANVTLDDAAPIPDSVVATLKVGGVTRATWSRPGGQWNTIKARRVALIVNATNDATGVYEFDLEVRAGSGSTPTIVSGTYIVVNRKDSDFGAGWWLAGLEQLFFPADSSLLWVGGDGSARHYQEVSSDTWVAQHPSRPDTISQQGTDYVRRLTQGVEVAFNSAGEHRFTTNRLGHETEFVYAGGRLSQIVLPSEGGDQTYTLAYDGNGKLQTVTLDTAGITVRTTSVNMVNGRVASFVDPDETSISFAYSGSNPRRPRTRTDRRGTVVTYTYDGPSRTLRTATLDMAVGDDIKFEVLARRRLGHMQTGSHNADSAFTLLRLPRYFATGADNANAIAKFWLDRFGAPTRIEDAAGSVTTLERHDAQYRALVTRLESPNGHVSGAGYDHRGNIAFSTDSSTDATTTYSWDPAWDLPTSIVPPEGDRTTIAYDSTNGNRMWQQDARGSSSRVNFTYFGTGNKAGLLKETDGPLTPPTTLDYDTRGNLASVTSPLGFVTEYFKDGLGRDTLVESPIDGSKVQEQWFTYDVMDRVTLTMSVGPQMSYAVPTNGSGSAPADTLWVQNGYDDEGNLLSVVRYDPSLLLGATNYTYDEANRRITVFYGGPGGKDSTVYDPAGNVTKTITRRGHTLTMTYDALDRLIERVIPEVDYAQTGCAEHGLNPETCDLTFPLYPNNGADLRIPADTQTFAYDVMGNLTQAYNRYSRVDRTYHLNGTLATDSLRLAKYDDLTDFSWHVYGLSYEYDLNGRREKLVHPNNLAPEVSSQTKDEQTYVYHAFGPLHKVQNVFNNQYEFLYDEEGRLETLNYPAGSEVRTYDDDSRLLTRQRTYHHDSFAYDQRGLVTDVSILSGSSLGWTVDNFYSGLGHLVATHMDPSQGDEQSQEFTNNAQGQLTWTRTLGGTLDPEYEYQLMQDGSGRLDRIVAIEPEPAPPKGWAPDTTYQEYDANGNVELSGKRQYYWDSQDNGIDRRASASYYGADQRLMVQQTYQDTLDGFWAMEDRRGMYEEYWYDALGRRVLVRRRTEGICTTLDCHASVERFVWDGDQMLYEIRGPGGDTQVDFRADNLSGQDPEQYGWVAYTHGAELDTPLDIIRMNYQNDPVTIIPHTNWRGIFDSGTDTTGAQFGCEPTSSSGCAVVDWPGPYRQAYHNESGYRRKREWFGSLVQGQEDATGLQYKRNRYYDPQTGQFTQEDPIGLAGGLNLYGFANGDPINFNDPFGLRADTVRFADDEAEALYKQLRQAATNASKSRNAATAEAGNALLGYLDELEAAEGVVTIATITADPVERYLGLDAAFVAWHSQAGAVILDPVSVSGAYRTSNQVFLAHELGHAYNLIVRGNTRGGAYSRLDARLFEGHARQMLGCSPKRPALALFVGSCP